jgi:hypothetical protein
MEDGGTTQRPIIIANYDATACNATYNVTTDTSLCTQHATLQITEMFVTMAGDNGRTLQLTMLQIIWKF